MTPATARSPTHSPTADTLSPLGLLVLLAGQLLPMIDFSIVNVALESLSTTLSASATELELIVAVYGVAFSVFLAMAGRLGDRYGRRRIFLLGVQLFGIASLLCGLAPSALTLLLARALQGVGAALIAPQVLATIHVGLSGHAHSRALGLYGAMGGLAFVVGQVLGGWLITLDLGGWGWRTVFLINLPICGVVLALGRRIVTTRSPLSPRVDFSGTLLLALLLLCLLLPLALGPLTRWAWPCVLGLAATPALAVALYREEARQEAQGGAPLLSPRLLKLPSMAFGLRLAVLFFSCWAGFMFTVALTLQSGAGLSPLASGNAFIVLGLSYFLASLLTSRVSQRLGQERTLLLGCAIQMPGLLALIATFWLTWPGPGVFNLMPATFFIGFGQAFIVGSFFRIGLAQVPAPQAGSGSAMLTTVQQAAFGLGAALLGTAFTEALAHTQDYRLAVSAALATELFLMTLLVLDTRRYRAKLTKK